MKLNYKNNKGFAILFAVVGAALVLSIGFTIAIITTKEVQLSAVSRESQLASYAADSGAECAELYKNQFASTTASSGIIPALNCGLGTVSTPRSPNVIPALTNDHRATTEFYVEFGETSGPNARKVCAYVTMSVSDTQFEDGTYSGTADDFNIASRGYNMPCNNLNNPRTLERGFEIDA